MIPIPYIGLSLMRLLSPRKAATEKGYFFINKQRIMEKISPQNQPSNYSKKKRSTIRRCTSTWPAPITSCRDA